LLKGTVGSLEEETEEVARRNFIGNLNVYSTYDTKLQFLLNLVEPLLLNDKNLEVALQMSFIELLVSFLKLYDVKRPNYVP